MNSPNQEKSQILEAYHEVMAIKDEGNPRMIVNASGIWWVEPMKKRATRQDAWEEGQE